MSFWITTQWPLLKSNPNPHKNVYVQQRHRGIGDRFHVGDRVLIYESQSGPTIIRRNASGTIIDRQKCRRGSAGVVATAEIAAGIEARSPGEGNIEYGNGRTANWAWVIPTRNEDYQGYVPRVEVLRVLGYSPDWNMHGFGEQSSGVKELTEPQYSELVQIFQGTARPPAPR